MRRSLYAAGLVAACMLPAHAQDVAPLAGLLAKAPHSMKLRQFDATWLRMAVKPSNAESAGTGDTLSKLAQIGMMADGGKMKGDGIEAALGLSMLGGMGSGAQQVCFTQGQTVAIGTETFLIAYSVERKSPSFLEMMMQSEQTGKEPDMAAMLEGGKWTEDTMAELTLVNVRTIGMLSGIRPFDLEKELAASSAGMPDLMQLMLLGTSKALEKPEHPAKPQHKPATKTKTKP